MNIGLSIPLLVCKNLDFWFQCLGTGTVFLRVFSSHKKRGSGAVMSHASTKSGLLTLAFKSATLSQRCFFFWDRESFSSVFAKDSFAPPC